MNIKFVSLKSVLWDLSTTVPEESYNEHLFYEWAAKGFEKIRPHLSYSLCNAIVPVIGHHGALPNNMISVLNVAISATNNETQQTELENLIQESLSLDEPNNVYLLNGDIKDKIISLINNKNRWQMMYKTSSNFIKSVSTNELIKNQLNEVPQYTICQGEYLFSSVENGLCLIAYLGTPTAENGDILIPNDEDLKEAIYHYCMYRWYSSKIATAEVNSMLHYKQEREFHLSQFQVLALKAKSLDLPDLATLENMANNHNRMVTLQHSYGQGFANLLIPEYIKL